MAFNIGPFRWIKDFECGDDDDHGPATHIIVDAAYYNTGVIFGGSYGSTSGIGIAVASGIKYVTDPAIGYTLAYYTPGGAGGGIGLSLVRYSDGYFRSRVAADAFTPPSGVEPGTVTVACGNGAAFTIFDDGAASGVWRTPSSAVSAPAELGSFWSDGAIVDVRGPEITGDPDDYNPNYPVPYTFPRSAPSGASIVQNSVNFLPGGTATLNGQSFTVIGARNEFLPIGPGVFRMLALCEAT